MNEQIIIHLDNLTEEEREQFTKLLGKASEEPSKESRVWKPKKIDQYYYINDFTDVCTDTWQEAGADYKRFKIGNVYKTREEVKQGKDGASIKLVDKMKALQWLADHMDIATAEQKAKIEQIRAKTAIMSGTSEEETEDDGFIEALKGEVADVWEEE